MNATQQNNKGITDFELHPLTPTIGMQVTGIDLTRPLDAVQVKYLRRALVDNSVLCFRNQNLTAEQQVVFSRNFGFVPEVPDSMFLIHRENSRVSVLHNDAERAPTVNNWHSDYSFALRPG